MRFCMNTDYKHSYKVCVEHFVNQSKNIMVTLLRCQVISDKFTAYIVCIPSVIHLNNAAAAAKYINIKILSHIVHDTMAIGA